MTVTNPIPDPRHEPRPWRPPSPVRELSNQLGKAMDREVLLDAGSFEIRPFSDWLEALVRIVDGWIVEAALRLNPMVIVEHWLADGVEAKITLEA